jgi:hypothetical protein
MFLLNLIGNYFRRNIMKMTVKEGYENLKKLMEQGHGDVVLMCSDGQGNTEDGAIYATVKEVTGNETGGEILDMKVGTKYVPLYFG